MAYKRNKLGWHTAYVRPYKGSKKWYRHPHGRWYKYSREF